MSQQTDAGIAADAYCTTGTSPTALTAIRSSPNSQQGPAETPHPAHNHNVYESVGSSHLPTVLVLGGISAHRHVCATPDDPSPGWWDDVVGPHALGVDTNNFRVLGFDWLGGPNSPTKPICEAVTTTDQAIAIAKVLDELRINSVAAIVGASYGGMVALAFASLFPSRVGHVVAISAAHRTHPMATALRSLQRRVVRFGRRTGDEAEGMSIARGIAMTTYRTTCEFEERFDVASDANVSATFPVEGYLESRGRAFADTFRPESFLSLSESLDLHRVDPNSIDVPLTLVAVDSDSLVPVFLAEELEAKTSGPCQTHVIESQYGHDAFLKDREVISEIVRTAITSPLHVANRNNVTSAVRASIDTDRHYGAVMPALHLSANFSFRDLDEPRIHDYSRSGNPTRDNLVDAIVALEHGAGGVVTSSGMSAIVVATQLLQPDDLLLAPIDCYGGTRRLFDSLAEQGRCRVEYTNLSDSHQLSEIVAAGRPKLIWVETPSNPLLRVTDLELVAKYARDVGALLAVDNTFLSPALQNPIDFGADLVVHSTTKFLNGHSDVVGGAIVARDRDIADRLGWWANCLGVTGAPFDSYLTLRGVRTLHARVAAHTTNTSAVVESLLADDGVERVYHPSIPSHCGHQTAGRQQRGWGSIVSFELAGGVAAVKTFVNGLRHFTLAESLGGVESLVAHPTTMTHAAMTAEAREDAGILPSLLRLSVGIEDADDLVRDLQRGLDRVRRRRI